MSAIAVSPKAIKQTKSLSINLSKHSLANNTNDKHEDNENASDMVSIFDLFYNDAHPGTDDLIHKDYQLDAYEQQRKENVEKRLETILIEKSEEKERLRREQEQEMIKIERNNLKKEVDFETRLDEMDKFFAQLTLELNQATATTTTTSGTGAVNLKLKEVQERTQLLQKQELQRQQDQERYRRTISDNLRACQQYLGQCETSLEEFKKLAIQDTARIVQADYKHFTNSIIILIEEINILLSKSNLAEQDVELSIKNVEQAALFTKTTQDRFASMLATQAHQQQQQLKSGGDVVGDAKPVIVPAVVGESKAIPIDKVQQPLSTTTTKHGKSSDYQSPRSRYLAYKQELAEFEKLCQKFLDTTQTPDGKKRRTDMQIFIRSTINVISSSSTSHLKEQLRKLLYLFNGEMVMKEGGGTRIKCQKTDYSFHFAINNAAKHFVVNILVFN